MLGLKISFFFSARKLVGRCRKITNTLVQALLQHLWIPVILTGKTLKDKWIKREILAQLTQQIVTKNVIISICIVLNDLLLLPNFVLVVGMVDEIM